MLIAMTFHLGLILVIITSLAASQFFLELLNASRSRAATECNTEYSKDSQVPLLNERPQVHGSIVTTGRPRSRSKPDAIFIHPNESNLARADAAAVELGLLGDTDRVHGNRYDRNSPAWRAGEGREAARVLLGSSQQMSEKDPFLTTDDSDSD